MGIKLLHRGSLNNITSLPNFMKIYQVAQNISIHDLYFKPAKRLGRFFPTVNN
jgi:hypothetical protein